MAYIFKSERLGFRNWEDKDLIPFALMNADPVVMEFFPNPLSTEASDSLVERMQQTFENDGHTFYAVDTLEDHTFIGFIGLVNATFNASFTPSMEIGWRLKKSSWNKGYATEGASACLSYAFNNLDCKEVYSITSVTNKKSQRIMEKIGMSYQGTFEHPKIDDKHPLKTHVFYKKVR